MQVLQKHLWDKKSKNFSSIFVLRQFRKYDLSLHWWDDVAVLLILMKKIHLTLPTRMHAYSIQISSSLSMHKQDPPPYVNSHNIVIKCIKICNATYIYIFWPTHNANCYPFSHKNEQNEMKNLAKFIGWNFWWTFFYIRLLVNANLVSLVPNTLPVAFSVHLEVIEESTRKRIS